MANGDSAAFFVRFAIRGGEAGASMSDSGRSLRLCLREGWEDILNNCVMIVLVSE